MYLRTVTLLLKNHLETITRQLGPLLCFNRIRDCKCRARSFFYLKNRNLELGCVIKNICKNYVYIYLTCLRRALSRTKCCLSLLLCLTASELRFPFPVVKQRCLKMYWNRLAMGWYDSILNLFPCSLDLFFMGFIITGFFFFVFITRVTGLGYDGE